jgi:TonB family protein
MMTGSFLGRGKTKSLTPPSTFRRTTCGSGLKIRETFSREFDEQPGQSAGPEGNALTYENLFWKSLPETGSRAINTPMKTLFTLVLLGGALSLCNLAEVMHGKKDDAKATENRNSNENANRPNVSGNSTEAAEPPPSNQNNSNSGSMVSGGVLNAKATSLPKPAYPPAARAANASGTVVVQVIVDETGKVTSANAVSGHPLLRASAVQAAYQARFTPTLFSGKPVKVSGTITYNFQL